MGERNGTREVALPRRHVAFSLEEGQGLGIAGAKLANHVGRPVVELLLAVGLVLRAGFRSLQRHDLNQRCRQVRLIRELLVELGEEPLGLIVVTLLAVLFDQQATERPLGVLLGLGLDELQLRP